MHQNRFGRPFEQQNNSGDLVKRIQEQPHKQSGVGSSVSNNQTFLSSSNAQTSTDSIRQHNSCTIHQQTRGDKVNEVMSTDLEIVELCGKQPNDIESSSHSRGSEHSCGQVEQNTSQTNRMVVEHSSGSNNFQSLGFTDDRLICNQPESQSFSVLFLETRALALDALSISWENLKAYAYPPLSLIPKVLSHMQNYQCEVILIAPFWPRQPWYPLLLHLLIAYPQKLTSERNLLTQSQGNLRVEHPNPEIYNLTAWRLSTISSKQKAFRKKLGNCFQLHGGQAHKRTTKQNSENLIAGVINGKLIPIRLL